MICFPVLPIAACSARTSAWVISDGETPRPVHATGRLDPLSPPQLRLAGRQRAEVPLVLGAHVRDAAPIGGLGALFVGVEQVAEGLVGPPALLLGLVRADALEGLRGGLSRRFAGLFDGHDRVPAEGCPHDALACHPARQDKALRASCGYPQLQSSSVSVGVVVKDTRTDRGGGMVSRRVLVNENRRSLDTRNPQGRTQEVAGLTPG